MARLVFRNGPYVGKAAGIPAGKIVTLGRNRDIELPLPDVKLSRRHCQVAGDGGGFLLRDLDSTNGTFVNGQRVKGEVPLHHLDLVVVGDTQIEFQAPELLEKQARRAATRVGVTVSAALEPDEAPAGHATGPAAEDLLAAALSELERPLPPLPEQAAAPSGKPKFIFCDSCNGSIPPLDLDLGTAKEIAGKLYCHECLARGATVGAAAAPAEPDAPGPRQDVDEILEGLNQVEEVGVKEAPPPASKAEGARSADEATKHHEAVGPAPQKQSAAPETLDDLMGADFEELDAPAPASAPERPGAAPDAPAKAPRVAPQPPPPEQDADLEEIKPGG